MLSNDFLSSAGHNTDGQFFITASKLAFDIQYSPKQIVSYIEKDKEGHSIPVSNVKIIDFACGKNHTVMPMHL